MAWNYWNPTQRRTVSEMNDYLERKKLFGGSGLLVAGVLHELGFSPSGRLRIDSDAIKAHLEHGFVIIGVDFEPGHASGYSDADHFVLLTDYDEEACLFLGIDPIFGRAVVYGGDPLALIPAPDKAPWIACEMIFLSPRSPTGNA